MPTNDVPGCDDRAKTPCSLCGGDAETEFRGDPVCIPCEDYLLGLLLDAEETSSTYDE
jgi:hypothetical protein